MNYYTPNFYQNNYQYPQQQFYQQPPQQIQQPYKLVDTVDMVKASEVPIGGFGIFPKVDMSEIYIKTWNPNGTTSILTYKPCVEEQPQQQQEDNYLIKKLEILEAKIDNLLAPPQEKKKGVEFNL